MRRLMLDALVLVVALVVGFAVATKTPLSTLLPNSSPTQTTSVSAQPALAAATATKVVPTATPAIHSSDPATAVQAVVEKANQEQQDAFAQNNPSLMKDTSTSAYYTQITQLNQQMASGGVSSIKLVKLEWGGVTLNSPTTATATTTETWQTTFSDGTVEEDTNQNVYTLVLQNGSWLIQTDDQPNSSQSGTTTTAVSTPTATSPTSSSSSPSSPATATIPTSQTSESNNWSGYSVQGGTYTSVTGTWVVPQDSGSGSAGATATWVGIGGVSSRDLIQAGTQETSNGSGAVQYQAWVETLPQASQNVPFVVSPGDSVTVTITETDPTAQTWVIDFKNNTTGKTYETSMQYSSSNSSAEWIQEAPSSGRHLVPVDSYGEVTFTNSMATKDGQSVSLAAAGATPITMVDSSGSAVSSPTSLTADGKGFTVVEVGSSSSSSTPSSGSGGSVSGFTAIMAR